MLKHVRQARKALEFDCNLSLVREEHLEGDHLDRLNHLEGEHIIDEDHDQLHITLDLQVVEREMEAAQLMTENASCEEDGDGDSIVTNHPSMLGEDEEVDDGASELAFQHLLLGGRLAEEGKEEEEKAPCRGSVVEGRDGLVAAWLDGQLGRRGFAGEAAGGCTLQRSSSWATNSQVGGEALQGAIGFSTLRPPEDKGASHFCKSSMILRLV